ncbi:uncharacterized protein LOC118431062 [Branchiostoma floridae]|uniref:Leucine-rich repeat protein SHOC-2 n=1 Tax=Branchiostoma floridae TaxID=7739 RepID=A0A9J7MCE3_BRAFL|nr:uncharacterized protein LOC118431062 [Branchiostoma floridae]
MATPPNLRQNMKPMKWSVMGKTTTLLTLDLSNQNLKQLPDELFELSELQALKLDRNKNIQLSEKLIILTNLNLLSLGECNLDTVPAAVMELRQLETLILSNNRNINLPDKMSSLINLNALLLDNCDLHSLPPVVLKLSHLHSLDLSHNKQISLPDELYRLENIKAVRLRECSMATVPPVVLKLTQLEELDLSWNSGIHLPDGLSGLTNIRFLNLLKTDMATVPPVVWRLTQLEWLVLSHNPLQTLPAEVGQLSNVKHLDLSHCQLRTLSPEVGRLTQLEFLDLRSNPVKTLPAEVGHLTDIKHLNLSYCKLHKLPTEVLRLTQLQCLDLRGNPLKMLPAEKGRLIDIKRLDLSNRGLTTLPPEVWRMIQLKWLNLRSNPLQTLPPEVGQLTNVKHLDLSHCQLRTLPPEMGRLTQLEWLDLSDNPLQTLPAEVGQLTKVKHLDLSYCQLHTLPPEVGRLTQLEWLDLSDNPLQTLPAEVGQFTNVKHLDLSYCQLHTLPPEVGRLTQLERLDLKSNPLQTLPAHVEQLTNVKHLDLSWCQLRTLPPEVGRLTQLEWLDLSSNPLQTLPAEVAQLTNVKHLDLSYCQLHTLPPEVGRLTQLEWLDLRSNPVKTLPAEVGHLTDIKHLNLSYCKLHKLPTEVLRLTQLQCLDLRGNPLKMLPAEKGRLIDIKRLDLSNRGLTTLPPEVWRMIQLKWLNLRSNPLQTLPPEVGQLTNVKHLDLSHCQLRTLPPEMGRLTQLEWLDLSDNPLQTLPAEVGQFTNVKHLDLSYCQLHTLPPEVGRLTQLERLDLKSNPLQTLPAHVEQLTNVKHLDLSWCQLRTLPPEVGRLTQLEWLGLGSNPLQTLPAEVGQLTNISYLYVYGNPLIKPPSEVCMQGISAVRQYFDKLELSEETVSARLKVAILGEKMAGKTSLVRTLGGGKSTLTKKGGSTQCVEITQWAPDDNITFEVYDFGGHDVYHLTHQFFLTQDALNLLTLNLETYRCTEQRYSEAVGYWLDTLNARVPGSVVTIVCTKIDQCTYTEKEEKTRDIEKRFNYQQETWERNIQQQVKQCRASIEKMKDKSEDKLDELKQQLERTRGLLTRPLRLTGIFCVSSAKPTSGLDILKGHILESANNTESFPSLRRILPRTWVDFEGQLLNLLENGSSARSNDRGNRSSAQSLDSDRGNRSSAQSLDSDRGIRSSAQSLDSDRGNRSSAQSLDSDRGYRSSAQSLDSDRGNRSSAQSLDSDRGNRSSAQSLDSDRGYRSSAQSLDSDRGYRSSAQSLDSDRGYRSSAQSLDSDHGYRSSAQSLGSDRGYSTSARSMAGSSDSARPKWLTRRDCLMLGQFAGLRAERLEPVLSYLQQVGTILRYQGIPELKDMVFYDPSGLIDVIKELFHHDLKEVFTTRNPSLIGFSETELTKIRKNLSSRGFLPQEIVIALLGPHATPVGNVEVITNLMEHFGLCYTERSEEQGGEISTTTGYYIPWYIQEERADAINRHVSEHGETEYIVACEITHFCPRGLFERLSVVVNKLIKSRQDWKDIVMAVRKKLPITVYRETTDEDVKIVIMLTIPVQMSQATREGWDVIGPLKDKLLKLLLEWPGLLYHLVLSESTLHGDHQTSPVPTIIPTFEVRPEGCTVQHGDATMGFPKSCIVETRIISVEIEAVPVDDDIRTSFTAMSVVLTVEQDFPQRFLRPVTVRLPWVWTQSAVGKETIMVVLHYCRDQGWTVFQTDTYVEDGGVMFQTDHFQSYWVVEVLRNRGKDLVSWAQATWNYYIADKVYVIVTPKVNILPERTLHLICLSKGDDLRDFFESPDVTFDSQIKQRIVLKQDQVVQASFAKHEEVGTDPRDLNEGDFIVLRPSTRRSVRLRVKDSVPQKPFYDGKIQFVVRMDMSDQDVGQQFETFVRLQEGFQIEESTTQREMGIKVTASTESDDASSCYDAGDDGLHDHHSMAPVVLLITDEYGISMDSNSTINRQVAILLSKHAAVYCTVLQATDESIEYAKTDHTKLLLPAHDPDDSEDKERPSLAWLSKYHQFRYPDLPPDVSCIIGHVDTTDKSAQRIKESRYPQAQVILINHDIPEDTETYMGPDRAMGAGSREKAVVRKAEDTSVLVFSVGQRIYNHFDNQYRLLEDMQPERHQVFLPKPSTIFENTQMNPPSAGSGELVVLSIGEVTTVEKLKGHDISGRAMGIVGEKIKNARLRVRGISEDNWDRSKSILEDNLQSGTVKPTLLPYGTQADIRDDMKTAHLVLMPSRSEPFGLVGLEAIAAGIPVLISDQSGLADMIIQLIPEKKCHPDLRRRIVKTSRKESDLEEDGRRWATEILDTLNNIEWEFHKAAEFKKDLLASKYWEDSHRRFLRACGIMADPRP